jgi:hypothetical protein
MFGSSDSETLNSLIKQRENFALQKNIVDEAYSETASTQAEERASLLIKSKKIKDKLEALDSEIKALEERIRLEQIKNWGEPEPGLPAAEKAYLLCDRTEADKIFHQTFSDGISRANGTPQVYLIYGGPDDCHHSLIERFRHTWIHSYEAGGIATRAVASRPIPVREWPYGGTLDERKRRLAISLFEACSIGAGLRVGSQSPADFRNILAARHADALPLFQHDIWQWDNLTAELIKWYIFFWEQSREAGSLPDCLIFLNIFGDGLDAELGELCEFATRPVQRPADVPRCLCVRLNLACVHKDDVLIWMRNRKFGADDNYRRRECKKIFRKFRFFQSRCKSMLKIENALKAMCAR